MSATKISTSKRTLVRAEQLLRSGQELVARARSEQLPGVYVEAEQTLRAAIQAFEEINLPGRMAIAQDALSNCYWRQGRAREARIVLRVALADLPDGFDLERGTLTVSLCQVERIAGQYDAALKLSAEIAPLVEAVKNAFLSARFHAEYANTLNLTGQHDPAIIEYTAAAFFFEEAKHWRHLAATDNNLADLLVKVGKFEDAHLYLDRARQYYESIMDKSALGQIHETRARAFAGQGKIREALEETAVSRLYLEGGDEKGLLDETRQTESVIRRSHLRLCKSDDAPVAVDNEDELEGVEGVERFVVPDASLADVGVSAGDQLLVALGSSVKAGDLVVVEMRDELFAGVYFKNGGTIILESSNDRYEDLELQAHGANVRGKVIGYITADEADDDDPSINSIEI